MFVGRAAESELLAARLGSTRLVTLVGPAGVGKTTLARRVAERVEGDFELGVRTVDLTLVAGAANVHEAIAGQLGFADFQTLLDVPAEQPVLLLIDNCEHVVDAAADAIERLLAACEAPTVVATSRRPLDIDAEVVISVGPLAIPLQDADDASNPCVEMFVQRARDAGGAFAVDVALIGEICRRLDGIPLAIELAAARTRTMTLQEILDNLDSQLDLLRRPRHRGASRHKSLRATIEASHALLRADEADLLRCLSVMSGSFDMAAVQAVGALCGHDEMQTRELLDGLVATSLVAADTSGVRARYRLLESIREFGAERIEQAGTGSEVREALANHVVGRLTAVMIEGQETWGPTLVADLLELFPLANDAARYLISADPEPDRAQLVVAVLWGLIHQAHTAEILDLGERTLDRWGLQGGVFLADAGSTVATGRYLLGDPAGAIELIDQLLPVADQSTFAPVSLRRVRGQTAYVQGDFDLAVAMFEEGAAVARASNLQPWAIELDISRAAILGNDGQRETALGLTREAVAASEALGSILTTLWGRAVEAAILAEDDPEAALLIAEPAIAACEEIDYPAGLDACLRAQCIALLGLDDVEGAARSALALLDALVVNGSLELHMAVEPAVRVLERAGRTNSLPDVIATWHRLPIMSMIASSDRPRELPGGRDIGRAELQRLLRRELRSVLSPSTPTPTAAAPPPAPLRVLRRDGDFWTIDFGGRIGMLKHAKGVEDLAALLAAPGREIHSLDLMGSTVAQSDLGAQIDADARRAYEDRIRELQGELDEADQFGDIGRAERAQQELDALVDQLVSATGLGGRARQVGSDAERARSAVTQRLRGTLRRLEEVHPDAATHLLATIHTGIFCRYEPIDDVRWVVEARLATADTVSEDD